MPEKDFFIYLENAVIFVWRHNVGGELIDFRVVLLAEIEGELCCVVRYDTAHGFPHRDVLGKKAGILAKEPFLGSSKKEVMHYAIQDFKTNAENYIRFFQEN